MSVRARDVRPSLAAGLSVLAAFAAGCGPPVVEVGTGSVRFEPLTAGQQVAIVCGPQGGQHIWTSVRARGVDAAKAKVVVGIRDPASGEAICGQTLEDVPLDPKNGWDEFTGIACFIVDPAKVRGRRLVMHGRVEDHSGRAADAEVEVVPDGPPGPCHR